MAVLVIMEKTFALSHVEICLYIYIFIFFVSFTVLNRIIGAGKSHMLKPVGRAE